MAATLGDILLVLLHEQPYNATEIQQRHTYALGPAMAVDHGRVIAALTRLHRLGLIRPDMVSPSAGPRTPRRYALTPTGQRRQHHWLHQLPSEPDIDDIFIRGMLAVVVADRATFDAVIGNCIEALGTPARPTRSTRRAPITVRQARDAYHQATRQAVAAWLAQLRNRERAHDRPVHDTS